VTALGNEEQREPGLADAYELARRAWPSVDLDRTVFDLYVRERLSVNGDAVPGRGAPHLNDLYLACACVKGVPGAFEVFAQRYLEGIGGALRGIDGSRAFADEVHQALWEKLFVSPKLEGYSGRGPLESWVGVAAQRIALSLKRREHPQRDLPATVVDQFAAAGDPELSYFKARYRRQFEEALAASLRALSERERVVLRLNVVGGASHARIGAMYRVNQSTVTRWIAGARARVWKELCQRLAETLGMAAMEVSSLVRIMRSDFQLSLSRILDGSDERSREP
jgi:RNA polymerase sigma-70 factor (ECF subfamily)